MARRREGGKGDVEFLPQSVVDPVEVESPLEEDRVEKVAEETGEGTFENVARERGRYEVSLLDLPRGRVHRKGKKPTASELDGGFEWIGRKQGGKCDDEWVVETAGEGAAWREEDGFEDRDGWEEVYD